MDLKISFDNKQRDFSKIKFIIVGDNPGDEEYLKGRFFIGLSGNILKNHFKKHELVNDFDEECLVMNKTFLSTNSTKELLEVKRKIGEKNFNNILIHTSYEIANYSNNLNVPIIIIGKSELKNGGLFNIFWKNLNNLCEFKDNIYVFKHTSNGNFSKDWKQFERESNLKGIDLLKFIGKNNLKSLTE